MPDTETGCAGHHHLALFYLSWRIWGCPLVSCGMGMHWTSHGWTLPVFGKNPSVHGLSPTTHQGCVLTDRSTLLLSFQRAILPNYRVWLAFCYTWPAAYFHWTNPTCSAVYPLALIHISSEVYLSVHKLSQWWQCDRQRQPSIGSKLSCSLRLLDVDSVSPIGAPYRTDKAIFAHGLHLPSLGHPMRFYIAKEITKVLKKLFVRAKELEEVSTDSKFLIDCHQCCQVLELRRPYSALWKAVFSIKEPYFL